MGEPFIGSEAVARGQVARSELHAQFTRIFPDVYVATDTDLTPLARARAGWLWSRRRGIIAGLTAAVLHGADSVDPRAPVEVIHTNRNSLVGLRIRGDRIEADEIVEFDGIPTTSPARTALDLACWYPTGEAVAAIDALARATDLELSDVEALAARYPGRRSIRWARTSLSLVDAGARSPQETWLRLQLVKGGLPTPQTRIRVRDESGTVVAELGMGWPDARLAVEYDDEQRRGDRWHYAEAARRLETVERLGWTVLRAGAGDLPAEIVRRVRPVLVSRMSRRRSGAGRASR